MATRSQTDRSNLMLYSNHLDGYQEPLPQSVLIQRPDIRSIGSVADPNSDLYVTAQIWADSKPWTLSFQTPYKAFKGKRVWNEWLDLGTIYSLLPGSAQIAITLWDVSQAAGIETGDYRVPFGGTTIPLFDQDGLLRQGRQKCHVHRQKVADGSFDTTTPWVLKPDHRSDEDGTSQSLEDDEDFKELERLEDLLKQLENEEIEADPMLDNMVFRHVEELQQKVSKKMSDVNNGKYVNGYSKSKANQNGPKHDSIPVEDLKYDANHFNLGQFFLYIDLPRFDHPVMFTDHVYDAPPMWSTDRQSNNGNGTSDVSWKPPPQVTLGPGINQNDEEVGSLIKIYDPEIGQRDNPVEEKHTTLWRDRTGGTGGLVDRDAKPNARARDDLERIMAAGPTEELTKRDKNTMWQYRHYLQRDKRALTKFLKSTNWNKPSEAQQAIHMLSKWTEIDVDHALELLGPMIVHPAVRAYAVDRLRKADDEELLMYLLQLVQALKFEHVESEDPEDTAQDSSLARFLISRAVGNSRLGNFLHWYLMVECDDHSDGQSSEQRKLFAKVEYDFMVELEKAEGGKQRRELLRRQGELIAVLSRISKDVRFSKEDRLRKIERLKKLMADPKNDLMKFDPPLPLPLDPEVSIIGCYPESSNVFKSSLFPLLLRFKTTHKGQYQIIFKTGDDLRQDQLVVQIIMLMDRLLRKENLDLKLSPYHILATSTSAGAVQFIPSMTLAAIVTEYKGSLLAYLRANNPDPNDILGVRKEAMDTYVKSCAGYCVITYLLGVGDRHLDNLLVTPAGNFFHADFGYILGRDPKPFAPLMKLSKEMIEGMGGARSAHYQAFKQHCFTAYTTLRKSSNLILNLFSLMVNANIPDIRMEPDKAVGKVKERFHLELRTEEEVVRMFEALMEDSVTAMFPALIDWTHGIVQRFRA